MKNSEFFRKADILLLLAMLLLGVASFFAVKMLTPQADMVEITVNGELYGSYPLSADTVLDISTSYGYNRVVIANGAVSVTESDCHNHDCQHFPSISRAGQVIMCLPHRLVISVSGEADDDVDVVVY